MTTTEERQAKAERLPWVRRIKIRPGDDPIPCQGRPRSAMLTLAPVTPCKSRATWRYQSLTTNPYLPLHGNYCWTHLVTTCFSDPEEERRVEKWFERHDRT